MSGILFFIFASYHPLRDKRSRWCRSKTRIVELFVEKGLNILKYFCLPYPSVEQVSNMIIYNPFIRV